MGIVAEHQLDDRVDEVGRVGGVRVRGAEAVEHRDLGALARDDERVREAGEPVALRPVQHHDRLRDDDTGGNLHDRAAGEEGVVQHGERVGRRVGAHAEHVFHVGLLAGRQAADLHALGDEVFVERVVHDATVPDDDEARTLAGFRGDGPAAGRALVSGLSELLDGNRTEPVEIEVGDPAVAPDLLFGGGPTHVGELLHGREPTSGKPIGTRECSRRFGRERTHNALTNYSLSFSSITGRWAPARAAHDTCAADPRLSRLRPPC